MARVELEDAALAKAVLDAAVSEFVAYTKNVRGFDLAEIVNESPAYFTGFARRLGVYLKKIEERGELVQIPTMALGDVYYTFADKINAAAKVRADDGQRRVEEFAKMRKFFDFRLGWPPDADELFHEPARINGPDGA